MGPKRPGSVEDVQRVVCGVQRKAVMSRRKRIELAAPARSKSMVCRGNSASSYATEGGWSPSHVVAAVAWITLKAIISYKLLSLINYFIFLDMDADWRSNFFC